MRSWVAFHVFEQHWPGSSEVAMKEPDASGIPRRQAQLHLSLHSSGGVPHGWPRVGRPTQCQTMEPGLEDKRLWEALFLSDDNNGKPLLSSWVVIDRIYFAYKAPSHTTPDSDALLSGASS
jgi:hypothetical protein